VASGRSSKPKTRTGKAALRTAVATANLAVQPNPNGNRAQRRAAEKAARRTDTPQEDR
jgi:hypothetical protein